VYQQNEFVIEELKNKNLLYIYDTVVILRTGNNKIKKNVLVMFHNFFVSGSFQRSIPCECTSVNHH